MERISISKQTLDDLKHIRKPHESIEAVIQRLMLDYGHNLNALERERAILESL